MMHGAHAELLWVVCAVDATAAGAVRTAHCSRVATTTLSARLDDAVHNADDGGENDERHDDESDDETVGNGGDGVLEMHRQPRAGLERHSSRAGGHVRRRT